MVNAIIGVVNQDPQQLGLLKDALRQEGYSTLSVREDTQARSRIEASRPDLVVVDLGRDGAADGWKLVQALRRDSETAKTPLLILSGDNGSRPGNDAPALAGRQPIDLLQGPYDAKALVAKVKQMLATRRR